MCEQSKDSMREKQSNMRLVIIIIHFEIDLQSIIKRNRNKSNNI